MTKTLPAVLAIVAAAGVAHANIIEYTLSGTLSPYITDSAGLNGATITVVALFDDSGVYAELSDAPYTAALTGSPLITITGAPNDANNAAYACISDLGFFPTFAGIRSIPEISQTEFYCTTGDLLHITMNTQPTDGSSDAVIGSPVELDDFTPAVYAGAGMLNRTTGEGYALNDVTITAEYVPTPGALALLGLAALTARRRR